MKSHDIERFKNTLSTLVRKGCNLNDESSRFFGRIISIGFNPLYTNHTDNKINKLVFHCLDKNEYLQTYTLENIVGCKVTRLDESSDHLKFNIYVLSKDKDKDCDEISLEIRKI